MPLSQKKLAGINYYKLLQQQQLKSTMTLKQKSRNYTKISDIVKNYKFQLGIGITLVWLFEFP